MPPISEDTLRKLAAHDTPTISNVIGLFEVVPRNSGYMDGRIKADFPEMPPMVGFACTASFRSSAPPEGKDVYDTLSRQVELLGTLPGPAVVVFQDLDDPPVGATFGEVMCTTYKAFGSTGLITSGGGRDLDQVQALGYPVFTGLTICSHAFCHILHLGAPVHVGGMVVRQGDLLHGDRNGVTRIPLEIAAPVAELADEYVEAEQLLLDYVKGSEEKTPSGLAAARTTLHGALDKLKDRARAMLY